MEEKSNHMTKKTLANFSVVLWAISLLLVGFHARDTWYGLMILLFSPLAFLGGLGGLAAYANWFYWWICLRLALRKQPFIATFLMMGLALLTLVFEEPLGASGSYASVKYWGYGAVLWGFSLLLMVAAVLDTRPYRSRKQVIKPYAIVFCVMMLGILGLKLWQWQQASPEEREAYLPLEAAFTTRLLTGIPLNPPPESLPNNHLPLEVVGDLSYSLGFDLKVNEIAFRLPETFLYQGYLVEKRKRDFPIFTPSNIQPAYRYQVIPKEENRAISILHDVANNKEIWRGEVQYYYHKWARQYPDYDSEIETLFDVGELPALPPTQDLPKHTVLKQACPVQPIPAAFLQINDPYLDIKNSYLNLDNRIAYFRRNVANSKIRTRLFCNENWIAALRFEPYSHSKKGLSLFDVAIHQRNNFASLDRFELPANQQTPSKTRAIALLNQYGDDALHQIQEIELKDNQVIVKHLSGDMILPPFRLK